MKDEYREGSDPAVSESVGVSSDEHEDTIKDIPLTAFVVLKFNDRIDLIREIPGMEIDHAPSMQEIRDMCRAAADDAQGSIITMRFTETLSRVANARDNAAKSGRLIKPRGIH